MTALVTATALSLAPTPSDMLTAHADLTAPLGVPPMAERSPRARLAALFALHARGGLDDGAPDFRWFVPTLDWCSEHDCARRVVAAARDAPHDDWLPPPAWLAREAAAYSAAADRWRRQAQAYRDRVEWEIEKEESLHAWARHFDAVADALAAHACRLARWGGNTWQCPRRVAISEVRQWLGEAAFARREWPE